MTEAENINAAEAIPDGEASEPMPAEAEAKTEAKTEAETKKEAPEPAEALPPEVKAGEAPTAPPAPEPSPKSDPVGLVDEFRRLERISEEYSGFKALFPDMKISELPEEVEKSIGEGVPLDAACALYRLKREVAGKRAASVNESNRELSPGAVKKAPVNYLTIDEIGAMSRGEVRKNLGFILKSLENQNKNRKE